MKKLNNRGFAISTVLYSMLLMLFLIVTLMLGLMASTRNNSKNFVKDIEEDLNRFSLTETEYLPTGSGTANGQEFFVPEGKSGWYKIELWGAAGGANGALGGKGAYTSGLIHLNANDRIYFYVGSMGSNRKGGENGGGVGSNNKPGGGGATDVRLIPGSWNDTASLDSRIMVAAGGGGAANSVPGEPGTELFGFENSNNNIGKSGTQLSGGYNPNSNVAGKAGIGGNGISNGAGGGSGYFGGAGGNNSAGGGGSSYISGYSATAAKSKVFRDGQMIADTNTGNGKAKITLVSEGTAANFPLKSINTKLNNVRYIRDCVEKTGLDKSKNPQWTNIEAMSNHTNVANISNASSSTDGARKCKTFTLNREYNLDDLSVWHFDNKEKNLSKRVLYNHTLEVAGNNGAYRKVIDIPEGGLSMPETLLGTRVHSRWGHDFSKGTDLPDGTYYISSALNPNKTFLTALNGTVDKNGDGIVDYLDNLERNIDFTTISGNNFQKWIFIKKEENGRKYYEIHEKESFQPLHIVNKQATENSDVITKVADDKFISFIKWEVNALGDGTYSIVPLNQPFDFGLHYYTTLCSYENSYGFNGSSLKLCKTTEPNNTRNRFYITNAYK